jgi:hypothetical protein
VADGSSIRFLLAQVIEFQGVIPAADRELAVVGAKSRGSPDSESTAEGTALGNRTAQERGLPDQEQPVSLRKHTVPPVGAIDRRTVKDRCANDDTASGLEGETNADRSVGKDRRPSPTALGEFRTDAK